MSFNQSYRRNILLFGMPRSGTTWIGKLLDSHPDVVYFHEPDSVYDLSIPLLCDSSAQSDVMSVEAQLPELWKTRNEKVISSRPLHKKDYFSPLQWYTYLLSTYLSKASGRVGWLPNTDPIRKITTDRPLFRVWKSIESLGRVGAIKEAINGDVFAVHLLRHPCGHILSTLRGEKLNKFGSGVVIYEDWPLFESLIDKSPGCHFDINHVRSMSPLERLALRWAIINEFALQSISDENKLVFRYEDLCEQPEIYAERLLDACGLTFHSQCAEYLESTTKSQQSGYYSINKESKKQAESWRKELAESDIRRVFEILDKFPNIRQYYSH